MRWILLGLALTLTAQSPDRQNKAKMDPARREAMKKMMQGNREGKLKPGDPAPDFTLKLRGAEKTVQLSSLRGKPVVLVFGSYT